MHAATKTSVGQCTPNTSRESATSVIHTIAKASARLRDAGWIRITHNAAAVANAATTSVCPLGKLEPQDQVVSHSAGRTRPISILRMKMSIAALVTVAATRNASKRCFDHSNARVTAAASGNMNQEDPDQVTASKNPVSEIGMCA